MRTVCRPSTSAARLCSRTYGFKRCITTCDGRLLCRGPRATAGDVVVLLAAAKLGFLPWNGCEVPGSFYSTGVKGAPGKDCQKVYQPAAEAEARAVQSLRQATEASLKAPEPFVAAPDDIGRKAAAPEAKMAIRDALAEDLRQRNKELVDSAWQSLE